MINKLDTSNQEINRIMEIWKDATIQGHSFIPKEYWLKSYDTVKEKYIPIAETYVYTEENIIKGFISIIEGEYLGALFIDTKYQGQGIGKKLMEDAKKTYGSLNLAVYKKNNKAVEFYKKAGFIIKKECINEETNEQEYIMSFIKE